MKIGYSCINLTLDCRSNRTFRLKNYSEELLIQTIENFSDYIKQRAYPRLNKIIRDTDLDNENIIKNWREKNYYIK